MNPLHVGPEAHVEHAVRFVQDQDLEAREIDRLVPHVIHQAARRRDDDVHAGAKREFLLVHRHAAEDGDARHRRVIGEALDLVFDLHGELARRREHERACARRLRRRLVEEALQDRNEERGGLARAGFRARDDVAAAERQRDHAALDRPGFGPAEIANARQQPRVERELVEGDRCRIERRRLVGEHGRFGSGDRFCGRVAPAWRARGGFDVSEVVE